MLAHPTSAAHHAKPSPGEIVVELRRTLDLHHSDLVTITREFINLAASRSAIHRLLRCHGLGRLANGDGAGKRPVGTLMAYQPGFIHIDVKYLPQIADESHRRYVFLAIDRALRFVYIALKADKSASAARRSLYKLYQACTVRIQKEFTNRLFGSRQRNAGGDHEFDCLVPSWESSTASPGRARRRPPASSSGSTDDWRRSSPATISVAPKTLRQRSSAMSGCAISTSARKRSTTEHRFGP